MNSIACDDTQLYITGGTDVDSPGTYLLAADMGIFTDITSTVGTAGPLFRVWPNPAKNELHIAIDGDIREVHLLDATGRVVRSWDPANRLAAGVLDVSSLAPGHYLLQARQASGMSTASVILR